VILNTYWCSAFWKWLIIFELKINHESWYKKSDSRFLILLICWALILRWFESFKSTCSTNWIDIQHSNYYFPKIRKIETMNLNNSIFLRNENDRQLLHSKIDKERRNRMGRRSHPGNTYSVIQVSSKKRELFSDATRIFWFHKKSSG
jgi:hypothetical protein